MNDTIINSIELLEFGVFKKSSEGNFLEDDEDCPVGYYIRTKDIELVKQTETIYAMIGTVFGIKYKLNSKFKGATAYFDCTIIHPELIKPGSNKGFTETSEFKFNSVDDVNFDFFEFENSWELKAGKWSFQIIEDEKLLLNKEFTIEIV
jgi:hypothetical protein